MDRLIILYMSEFNESWQRQDLQVLATKESFGTTRERKEKETLQTLLGPTSPFHMFRGTDCTVSKSEHVSKGLQSCSQKNRIALFHNEGFHQFSNGYRRGTNRYIRDLRIPTTHISNQFRWRRGTRVGIMKIGLTLWISSNIWRSEQTHECHSVEF